MAAPRKVKEKAALAETLIAKAAEGKTPTGNPPNVEPSKPPLAVVPDTPPAAPPTGKLPADNPYAIAPPEAVPAMPDATVAPNPQDWEHKFNVLKGIFDNQRAKDADSIQQLSNQVGALTEMVDKPTTRQDTFHPDVPATAADYGMTEEQIDELGGMEFVENIRKISAVGMAPDIAALASEVSDLKESQTETKEDVFYARLNDLCPHWAEINKMDQFEAWLLEGEGLSGIPRRNFLTNAYDKRDADTAALYFNEFVKTLPTPPSQNPNVLQDIVPVNTGGAPPSTGVQGTIYSVQSITQFYKDKGLGKFKGREDEAAAIEADIFAAQNEGRILRPRRA